MKPKCTEIPSSENDVTKLVSAKYIEHTTQHIITKEDKIVKETETHHIINGLCNGELTNRMLATQILSTYNLQQELVSRLNLSYHPEALNQSLNCITKLSNLFINQIDLLKRLNDESKA